MLNIIYRACQVSRNFNEAYCDNLFCILSWTRSDVIGVESERTKEAHFAVILNQNGNVEITPQHDVYAL